MHRNSVSLRSSAEANDHGVRRHLADPSTLASKRYYQDAGKLVRFWNSGADRPRTFIASKGINHSDAGSEHSRRNGSDGRRTGHWTPNRRMCPPGVGQHRYQENVGGTFLGELKDSVQGLIHSVNFW